MSTEQNNVGPFRAVEIAETNWRRWEYAKQRGHLAYMARAQRCERFYLGGGLQWERADVQKLKETGDRPHYEWNGIFQAVNTAIGHQIHNRMDITFQPRGGMADQALATVRTKVAKQILDRNDYHFKETQVFADGMIQERGFFDVRMCFDKNIYGDIDIDVDDPLDVAPDPDAKSYDPEKWYDVTQTRWYTLDEIEQWYGQEARSKTARFLDSDPDWGEQELEALRAKFGNEGISALWDAWLDEEGTRRFRIIDRQRWQYKMTKVAVYRTGEIKSVEDATPEMLAQYAADGAIITKRMHRSVLWQVTTRWDVLHNDTSPYDFLTKVPFFPYFRRGQTRGFVNNAISPQEVVNKAISQFVHIVNTTANSGWVVEENSLANMEVQDLNEKGSTPGFLIIYRKGAQKPEKIKPNEVPRGMDRLIELAIQQLKDVTAPDAMRGLADTPEVSGIAIQSKQFASMQQLGVPLDNLGYTRKMVGKRIDWLVSNFIDNHRIYRITETDPKTGRPMAVDYEVNKYDPVLDTWQNDMTVGEYDTVISEQPVAATFQNAQFQAGLEMRNAGVAVPDATIIKNSPLADKAEILEEMNAAPKGDPLDAAKAALAQAQAAVQAAQADKIKAETVNTRVTAMFAGTQAAVAIAGTPAAAPLADKLLRSAGFEDQDEAPIVPEADPALAAAPLPALPHNTSPLVPASPSGAAVGARAGIEGGGDGNEEQ